MKAVSPDEVTFDHLFELRRNRSVFHLFYVSYIFLVKFSREIALKILSNLIGRESLLTSCFGVVCFGIGFHLIFIHVYFR